MHLFFAEGIVGNECNLNEEESAHSLRVLRLREGDEVSLMDGKGGFYKASISGTDRNICRLTILERKQVAEKPFHVHITVAPTKSPDRLEWFVEKATELGVNEISPVFCDRSERRVLKTDRLHKVIRSAAKQAHQLYLPVLNEPISLKEFLSKNNPNNKLIAIQGASALMKNSVEKNTSVLVLIGPEGDFTPGEITFAKESGFREVSLGENRLRTETAALAACHTVIVMNQ